MATRGFTHHDCLRWLWACVIYPANAHKTNHLLILEKPEAVTQIIREFLRGNAAAQV